MRITKTLKGLAAFITAITALGVTVVILDENYMPYAGGAPSEIGSPDVGRVLYPRGQDTIAHKAIAEGPETSNAAMPSKGSVN